MNPNDPYFHQGQQQQPGYGVAAGAPSYGGGVMPVPRPITPGGMPVPTLQPQQQFPSNGPPQMNSYGQPSPRPPVQLYTQSPQPTPSQLAQHMGGMNLMDSSVKSPLPPGSYPPMNGNVSPAPPMMLQRPPMNMQAGSPMHPPQQSGMIPGMGLPPRAGGLMPPTGPQQQMGMSPQQYQNGSGLYNVIK